MPPAPFSIRLLAIAALPLGACFGSSDASDEGKACSHSQECQELCSPLGECVLESTALDIRVNWTINDVTPKPSMPESCGSITNFELRFESESPRDLPIAYFPVPCMTGTVFFPAMPSRIVRVTLSGFDARETFITSETREVISQKGELFFDFSL